MPVEYLKETPSQTAGPYGESHRARRMPGRPSPERGAQRHRCAGERIVVEGVVLTIGAPLRDDAELWQADSKGRVAEYGRRGRRRRSRMGLLASIRRTGASPPTGGFRPRHLCSIFARGINIHLHTRRDSPRTRRPLPPTPCLAASKPRTPGNGLHRRAPAGRASSLRDPASGRTRNRARRPTGRPTSMATPPIPAHARFWWIRIAALLLHEAEIAGMIRAEAALARVEARLGVIREGDGVAAGRSARKHGHHAPIACGGDRKGWRRRALARSPLVRAGTADGPRRHGCTWGATSAGHSPISPLVLRLRDVLPIIEARLNSIIAALAALARAHRDTIRPRADPIAAGRADPLRPQGGASASGRRWRHRRRITRSGRACSPCSSAGATGTLAALGEAGPARYGCAGGRTRPCPRRNPGSTGRDRLEEFAALLAMIAGTIGKWARHLDHLSRYPRISTRSALPALARSSTRPCRSRTR